MKALELFVRAVDGLNDAIGRVASWLVLAAVLVCASVALLRYAFNTGAVWLQELYVMCFGVGFMLMAGYAYLKDNHVRVDIFQAKMTPRGRAWVEVLGILFLLFPWLIVVALFSAQFVLSSWSLLEASGQPGGLPGLFLFKSAIWAFCALLGLQGLANLVRNVMVLMGRTQSAGIPLPHGESAQAASAH